MLDSDTSSASTSHWNLAWFVVVIVLDAVLAALVVADVDALELAVDVIDVDAVDVNELEAVDVAVVDGVVKSHVKNSPEK